MKILLVGKGRRKSRGVIGENISYMAMAGINETNERQLFPIIENLVCNHFGENIGVVKTRKRFRNIVICRQVIMFLMRRNTTATLKDIANRFYFDHSTVIHALQTVSNLMDTDESFKTSVLYLESQLQ